MRSGAYSGWKRGGLVDQRRQRASASILYSMPYFVIGMPLLVIFAAGLGWFPTSGMLTARRDLRVARSTSSSTSRAISSCRSRPSRSA